MTTVLIVDDEALIRWSIAETLEAAGFVVIEASTAREALQRLGAGGRPITVVLLDLKLPDSSDLGLLKRIRAQAPAAKVILMTAHGSAEVLEEARREGAYRAVSKPFDMQGIVGLVQSAAIA